jgi:recombination protein RecT
MTAATATPDTRSLETTERRPPAKPIDEVKNLFNHPGVRASLLAVLPRHVTPDRLVKVALGAINRTPKLLECTRDSLLLALLQAAELGLEPGSALGEAHLVPFWDAKSRTSKVQMIPGFRGLIALARRSGEITTIEAHVVHKKDEFSYVVGSAGGLRYVPCLDEDPGEKRFAFAYARLKGGAEQVEVVSKSKIDAIRNASLGKIKAEYQGRSPWVTHEEEMWRKTAVRAIAKYLPLSVELAKAIDIESRAEAGESQDMPPELEAALAGESEEPKRITKTATLKAKLAATVEAKLEPPAPPPANPDAEPTDAPDQRDDEAQAAALDAEARR